jgi:predicted aminopeptidase
MWKKVGLAIFAAIVLLIIFNFDLLTYGLGQAKGQFHILWNARPVAEVLQEDGADSLKNKLRLVEDIRRFAFDSLDLTPSDNYTTVFDQQGKELLWVVTACEPYRFEPVVWNFPVIGSFTYKGFFDFEKVKALALDLKEQGYDVSVRSVSGWSTLGWFKDPILSNMLFEEEGELANTIIHELTHGTLFIPDSMTFNENLASFIGHQGSLRFLNAYYGDHSDKAIRYLEKREDSEKFTRHLIRSAEALDTLYQTLSYMPERDIERFKQGAIQQAIDALDTVSFHDPSTYGMLFEKFPPNNAFFISFLSYRARQEEFGVQLRDEFNNDIRAFIDYWKQLYSK